MSAYGLWSLVVINAAVFVIFAFSFTHPRTARDWRYPGLDLLSHDVNPLHLLSGALIGGGFVLLASAGGSSLRPNRPASLPSRARMRMSATCSTAGSS